MWRKLSAMHNVEAKYIIGGGMIQDAVNDIIQRYDVDIIIMGSHGRGQKNETWGSTTIQIVKQVDLPTLVIKQPLSDVKFDHIVYASTFNVEDRKDFTHFLQLIQPTEDTQIHLLSIDTSNYFSQPTIVMKEAMKDFIDLAYPHQCEAHFYPDYSVDAGIRHFIEEQNPDLLVMSNKHDKPIRHALRGNHTIKSIKDYAIPILSIDFPDED
jgi:nucleotide-binding universal stress UspA family protein